MFPKSIGNNFKKKETYWISKQLLIMDLVFEGGKALSVKENILMDFYGV